MKCCVPDCTNDPKKISKRDGITFHKFPKEASVRKSWIDSLGINNWELKEHNFVCSQHFQPDAFYETKGGLRRVKSGTFPVSASGESVEKLDSPAALKVCRVCLAMDVRMTYITDNRMDLLYEQITGVSLDLSDQLPKMLCWECTARLVSSHRFRDKALKTQSLLLNKEHVDSYLTIGDIKSINRTDNQLKSTLVQKHYDASNCDLHIREYQIMTKSEIENGEIEGEKLKVEIKAEVKVEFNEESGSDHDVGFDHAADKLDVAIPEVLTEVNDEQNKVVMEEHPVLESEETKSLMEVSEGKVKEGKLKRKVKRTSTTTDRKKNAVLKKQKPDDGLSETLFTIISMTYEEQIAEIQKRQEMDAFKNAPFKCTACYRGYQNQKRYDAHVARHSEQSGEFECLVCKSRTKTKRALRHHLNAFHTNKISCKRCPFVTRNKSSARHHQKWHAGTKYQCPHCDSEFDQRSTYMGHIRISHVSKFVCELCGFSFVSKKGIDVHKIKMHRLDENFTGDNTKTLDGPFCADCDIRFASQEAYDMHLGTSSVHCKDDDPNRVRNDSTVIYNKKKTTKFKKNRRIRCKSVSGCSAKDAATKEIACEVCGEVSVGFRMYYKHFRAAHPDRNRTQYRKPVICICEQCGMLFTREVELEEHMNIHTGTKLFKCEECDKTFPTTVKLNSHRQKHFQPQPCPFCKRLFTYNNCKRHILTVHQGEKLYKCDICEKSVTSKFGLQQHIAHVHYGQPWPKRARRVKNEIEENDSS